MAPLLLSSQCFSLAITSQQLQSISRDISTLHIILDLKMWTVRVLFAYN